MDKSLRRFVNAQERDYDTAYSEIAKGKKVGHWMWYIFPQLKGLGKSTVSDFYGISGIEEAREFLEDDFLGGNLVEISSLVLGIETNDLNEVFGAVDYMKLRSCMTLFATVESDYEVFFRVLEKYYDGEPCEKTLKILNKV